MFFSDRKFFNWSFNDHIDLVDIFYLSVIPLTGFKQLALGDLLFLKVTKVYYDELHISILHVVSHRYTFYTNSWKNLDCS